MSTLQWRKFFRDNNGNESMTLLMLFLSYFPMTWVMITQHTENIFYAYSAAFTGLAANRQWATRNVASTSEDVLETDSDSDSDSEPVPNSKPLASKSGKAGRGKRRPF
jgi:hypothetical protein